MASGSEARHQKSPPAPPEQKQPLRCVMVPQLAMGHIIPMMDLGLLMAEQGVSVTLCTTAANAMRLAPALARARAASLPFTVTPLPFQVEGLPDGLDNADLTSTASELWTLMAALDNLEPPLRDHLKNTDLSRTFLVSDFAHTWTRVVSSDLGIPRYVFYSVPCFTLFCHRVLQRYYDANGGMDESEPFIVPALQHRVELTRARAPTFFPGAHWRQQAEAAEASADGIIVNTFAGMEGEYLRLYEKEIANTVWPVGPLVLYNSKDLEGAAVRGSNPSVDAAKILGWLDRQKPQSVVYLCLGSMAQTTPEQAAEIGLGLEASGHPFLWVVRSRGSRLEKIEAWLAAGFVDRTKDRGLVVPGWAPQQLILSHAAIGGFLTHCGGNSASEALAFGVPLATWPFGGDQFVNERFLVDVLCVGVAVGVKEPHWWWNDELTVGRRRVEEVVRELMNSGEEADGRRRRAKEIAKKAKRVMEAGDGESRRTLAALIQDASRRVRVRALAEV